MNEEDKRRKSIDILAQRYREESGNKITHEQAKQRIIKAITKRG